MQPAGEFVGSGRKKPGLAATNVQVCAARIVCDAGDPESQSRPLGRSTATTGLPAALIRAIARSKGGRGSPVAPVPSKALTIHWASAKSRSSRPASKESPYHCDRHTAFLEYSEIHRCIAAQIGRFGKQQHLHGHAAQIEMPGDHESVAAIVSLAAADRHQPIDAQSAKHVGRAAPAFSIRTNPDMP